MTIQKLIQNSDFTILNAGGTLGTQLTKPFTCDLLSVCMSKAPVGAAWITVMGNVNAIAVAVLTDVACIVLAEQAELDPIALKKAQEQNVTVLKSNAPVFETALQIYGLIHG